MRDLTSADLGILLSLFAVLLIAFGIDFRMSRRSARLHRRRAVAFGILGLIGELSTALALVLTWVALWSPRAWEAIDGLLVLVPGSIAVLCAVTLTIESVFARVAAIMAPDAPEQPSADAQGVARAGAAAPGRARDLDTDTETDPEDAELI